MSPYDPMNPLGGDQFQIGRPAQQTPFQPHVKRPKRLVPEVDELFAAQKALVKVINNLHSANQDDVNVQRALERAEGAYRRLREWLAKHGNQGM